MDAESVYIAMMTEAASRLMAADRFTAHYSNGKEVVCLGWVRCYDTPRG